MVENKPGVGIEETPPLVYVETVGRTSPYVPPKPQGEWTCPQCTLLNPARKLYCIACFHRHPDLTPANIGPSQDYDDDEDYDDDDEDIEYDNNYYREENIPLPDTNERCVEDRNVLTRSADDELASSSHQNILPAEEDPFHKKIRRRLRRKRRMVAGGAAGVAAGVVLGSPALLVAGLVGGAVGTRIVSKHREQLKDERLAMERYEMETKARATATVS